MTTCAQPCVYECLKTYTKIQFTDRWNSCLTIFQWIYYISKYNDYLYDSLGHSLYKTLSKEICEHIIIFFIVLSKIITKIYKRKFCIRAWCQTWIFRSDSLDEGKNLIGLYFGQCLNTYTCYLAVWIFVQKLPCWSTNGALVSNISYICISTHVTISVISRG